MYIWLFISLPIHLTLLNGDKNLPGRSFVSSLSEAKLAKLATATSSFPHGWTSQTTPVPRCRRENRRPGLGCVRDR